MRWYRDASEANYNLSIAGSSARSELSFFGFLATSKPVYIIKNYSNIGGTPLIPDYKLAPFLKIGQQLALSQRKTAPPVGSEAQLHNAPFRTLPVIPIKNANGSWGVVPPGYGGMQFGGPNHGRGMNRPMLSTLKNNLQGNVYAEVKLPLHLTFRSNVSYSYYEEAQDFLSVGFRFWPGSKQH